MQLHLPRKLQEFVDQQVASGRHIAAGEVVQEALYLLRDREELRRIRSEELRKDIQEGLDDVAAGRVHRCSTPEELDDFFEDIKRRGRIRLAANEATKAEANGA